MKRNWRRTIEIESQIGLWANMVTEGNGYALQVRAWETKVYYIRIMTAIWF